MSKFEKRLKFEVLESRQLLAADPIITEFMASNDGTIEDGNGATPDWIEIYNNGDQSIDLAGYRLTDDPMDINKWVFPSVVLGEGEFLLVFASGDNTPDSAGFLHANFSLAAGGEYVALINPSGTVLSEYGTGETSYPAQTNDVSYGLAFDTDSANPVHPGSTARYLIPADNSVDSTWTSTSFDDSLWALDSISMGYEASGTNYADLGLLVTPLDPGTITVYVRAEFTITNPDTLLDKLQMKYDDGFIAYINGSRVASANAPATGVYNSVATADHPDGQAVNYKDYDLSNYSHLLNEGTNTLAIHALNRNPSSDMLSVPNLLLTTGGPIDPPLIGQLEAPTPGLPNTNLRASDVSFSKVGGVFVGSFQLSMVAAPGEIIRYSTDGTNPDSNSPIYTGPLIVNTTTQFRARAYGSAGQVGPIVTATYVQSTSSVANFDSDLPVIVLDNFNQGVPDREFQDSSFALYDVDPNTGRSSLTNPADVTSVIGQHKRGKSTFASQDDKPNLRIELRDEFGADQNVSLLGMPSESDWILYAPWTIDRAMVRHALIYDLSRQTGSWAPRTRFVEVYSNFTGGTLSDSDYRGVYLLMEVIKRDDRRVDISELTPSLDSAPEITGGYILQIDEEAPDGDPNDESWLTSRGTNATGGYLNHSEPERLDLSMAQRDYIRNYVQNAEDALYGSNFTDPVLGYEAYFDVDAAIDFHLFNVFSGNPDAFRLSTYLTKNRGEKLTYGPLWDFDRTMGPDEDLRTEDPTKWMVDEAYHWVRFYLGRMMQDPDFEQLWVDRWNELRQTVFSNANLEATIFGLTDQLTESHVRNAVRYPGPAPNGGPLADPGLTGWEGEVSHLKNWLIARANWIDTQVITAPILNPNPGNVTVNSQITLSAPGSSVYYTLDGSDPRNEGGGIKPGALLYTGPITITESTQITARAKGAGDFFGGWSGLSQGLLSIEVPADATSLRITELQYHPANPTPAELAVVPGVDDNDFEYVELHNPSINSISLNGVRFIDGIEFDFSTGSVTSLGPGQSVVIVENLAAFDARYGSSMLIAGQYTNDFSNGGEQVVLVDENDAIIHDFIYSDDAPWPTITDGGGPSLEVVSSTGNYGTAANWRASFASQGTPGAQTQHLPGDFDSNAVVNGLDFLLWQQNSAVGSLADWETDYSNSANSAGLSALGQTQSHNQVAGSSSLIQPGSVNSLTQRVLLSTSAQTPLRSAVAEKEGDPLVSYPLVPEQLNSEANQALSDLQTVSNSHSATKTVSRVEDDDHISDESWDLAFDAGYDFNMSLE